MCDTFVALSNFTANGDILFAKNSDRQFDEAQYIEFIEAKHYRDEESINLTCIDIKQVSQTYAVLLSKPHWLWGAEMGANEHGLVIGNEAVFTKTPAEKKDGIIGMDLVRLGLERASDVDEAIHVMTTLLEVFGQAGECGYKTSLTYDNSFIIADKKGAKVLETAGREWAVHQVENYYTISNILTIGADYEWASSSLSQTVQNLGLGNTKEPINFKEAFLDKTSLGSASGKIRQCHSSNLLGSSAKKINVSHAFNILRDHTGISEAGSRLESRQSLCKHPSPDEELLGQTTGSMVSSINRNKQVYWLTGTARPCVSLFKPIVLGVDIPDFGPVPGSDETDTVSLWWRHQSLCRYLSDKSTDIAIYDAYVKQRDQLEQEFIRIMNECPEPSSKENKQLCSEAVRTCWHKASRFEDTWYEKFNSSF